MQRVDQYVFFLARLCLFPHVHPPACQVKVAGFILVPLSLPAAVVAGLKYDHEFRDDVEAHFPEIVDVVRHRVGFQEDLGRRRAELEKTFISTQPVGVHVQLRNGRRLTTVASPLRDLLGLYEAVAPREEEGPIVSLEFQDISQENVQGMSPPPPTLAVIPPETRGMNMPSLWDKIQDEVGGGVGDTLRLRREGAGQNEKQLLIQQLEASLEDLKEEIGQLQASKREGSARAIDDIEADIYYLAEQRRDVRRQLRGLGKWWRYWW
ncbi:hypothetical protein NSK_000375 [Nannochloropsis salina CCMP1776]|uniref:Uncharacterized protein n=1 Tax=Nannochloropsis salina CCMP1776 TaxID=1027361 RepID=A0A4D9D8K3_9STRA|nr:hypothetical protein NSK_000375 [Nannochloropsis salina CCMP1776]|eukprot:TFJ88021.1 hypothetical protein NSK_000375 [Nannochloropsis salina CCMP1776]